MTPKDPAVRTLETYEELLALIEVDDVFVYELHSKDKAGFPAEDFEDDETSRPYSTINTSTSDSAPSRWNVFLTADTQQIGFRARVRVNTDQALYVVDAAIFYSLGEEVVVPEELLAKFVREVAFLGLYPYIREAVQTSAIRLRNEPPVLPVIQAGKLKMTMTEASSTRTE